MRALHRFRWAGVLALLAVVTISYVDRVNVSVLITDPAFLAHFGLGHDRAAQGALMSTFLVGYGVAALLLTPWYEAALGVRRGLVVSLVSWSLLTLVSPVASAAVVLLALRLLLGSAEGPLFSLKTMYVKARFDDGELGRPNAVTSMGVSLGSAIGIPLVAAATVHFGWSGSFLVLAALNLLVGLPLVLLFVAASRGAPRGGRTARQRFTAALRTPRLGWILLVEIATLGYLWGSSSWLPSYLLQERHFSLAQMGVLAALPFLVSLLSGFAGGWLVDRLPPARVAAALVLGSAGTVVCTTAVVLVDSRWLAAAALVLANGFWGLQGPAIPTLVQQHAAPGAVGSAYGLVNGIGNLVSAALPAAVGALISVSGRGFAAGYGLLAATQVVTLAVGLVLLRRRPVPRAAGGAAPHDIGAGRGRG